MALRLMPNAERLVMDFLRSVSDLTALVDQRIFTAYDATKGFPQVVITRFGGSRDQYQYLDQPRLQIEVWTEKGDRPLAWEVAETVAAAMGTIVGSHALGMVTRSVVEAGPRWLPDSIDTGGPARPRYILDVRLHVHPLY